MIATDDRQVAAVRYRKKPVAIAAVQWSGEGWLALPKWARDKTDLFAQEGRLWTLSVRTPEGDMLCNAGDWLICGVVGEVYPCKRDIFEKTYDPVEAEG